METGATLIIFYKYTPVADPAAVVVWQKELCTELGIKGRILVASEGINGTCEGSGDAILKYEQEMLKQDGAQCVAADFRNIWFKHSESTGQSFHGLKVRERAEIVTLGLGENDIDPNEMTGTHIDPATLKSWIESGEDFEIVDMRNDYEFKVGHFKNSIHPNLENFRDLPQALPHLESIKHKKVLTVCTYGVRCEKASGYLKSQGFENVYQLEGGIGTYMKTFPGEDFLGSLYVFDERILEQDAVQYEVVGVCEVCTSKTENFTNCAYGECHKKMLACNACLEKTPRIFCSDVCEEIITAGCSKSL